MVNAKLLRVDDNRVDTKSLLCLSGLVFPCLEPPWRNNARDVSRIPPGYYVGELHMSPTKGLVIWIKGVPDREYIYFHAGNTIKDTLGCVMVGMIFGRTNGYRAVFDSRIALDKLIGVLGDNTMQLHVKDM